MVVNNRGRIGYGRKLDSCNFGNTGVVEGWQMIIIMCEATHFLDNICSLMRKMLYLPSETERRIYVRLGFRDT